ncbi:hypothetical protein [Abiotrophia defectiva]|uniref:hypothetical protein n=1 Tax=Abiotrophia defectiva TaxID=46125 RepID=UPI0026F23C2E|nr:hypothetical protein [Abiotrophia defectiva]
MTNKNRGKYIVYLFIVILAINFLLHRRNNDDSTSSGEIIATFDNGIGGVDTMVRNGKALTLKVSSKSGEVESLEWKDKSAFNYDTKKELEEGKGIVSAEEGFQMKLVVAYHMQQSIYSAGAEHYPLANVSTQANIKKLKINGQAVDEVKEYVDADGHTWYLWYFKNLKLREDENVVSFD